jgi:hypothetical protein
VNRATLAHLLEQGVRRTVHPVLALEQELVLETP